MLVDIANHTDSDKFRVSVCVTRFDTTLAEQLRKEITLYVLQRKSRFNPQGIKKFAEIVKSENVSLLHSHGRSSFSFAAFIKQMKLVSVPLILHDHYGIEKDTSIPLWFKYWGRHYLAFYVGVYDKLTAWAERANVPRGKIGVITNALDFSRILRAETLDIKSLCRGYGQEKLGIWVGGIRAEKGFDVLIEAISKVANNPVRLKFRLFIVGGIADEAYSEYCKRKIEHLALQEYFVFLGRRMDVPQLIKGAEFGVISSISESGPLVLIEYLAVGLPVVATRVGSVSHQAEMLGVQGFVNPGDASALAQGIIDLLGLSDSSLKDRGCIGANIAIQHFDIEKKMPEWYRVYDHVLRYC